MGWRGTLRSIEAASRRASREAERQRKAHEKASMIADASYAVSEWRSYLQSIVSFHVDPPERIDWEALRDAAPPIPPELEPAQEVIARKKLDEFQPRLFDFLAGGSERKRLKLEEAVISGQREDEARFRETLSAHEELLAEWQDDKELATRLLTGDVAAEKEVISQMASLAEDDRVATRFQFQFAKEFVHATAFVSNDDIVPTYRRKQLQSGRLSETKMPVGERHELYQDYVCSVALKLAGDLLSLLPRDEVFVTCAANMLDSSTGHMIDSPILSVRFVRPTFEQLRLDAIDPSDSMKNFNHQMNFKKTRGLMPIEPLKPVFG